MAREYVSADGSLITESGARQYISASGSATNETASGAADGNAAGVTLTGTATMDAGAASGAAPGTAAGATLTGTATMTAGTATGGTPGMGTLTTRPQKNNTGTLMANETGAEVFIWNPTTGALVLKKTGVTLDSAGVATVTDAALVAGTDYIYEVKLSGNRRRLNPKAAT